MKKSSVYLYARDYCLFTNPAWYPRLVQYGMRSISQYCSLPKRRSSRFPLSRRYHFAARVGWVDIMRANFTAPASFCTLGRLALTDKRNVNGGEVFHFADVTCRDEMKRAAGHRTKKSSAIRMISLNGFQAHLFDDGGAQAEDFRKLPFCNSKKTDVFAGGQGPVDCGRTTVITYRIGAGFGNKLSQVLLPTKNSGGRREWNKDKHEHCSTGISYEATP